MTTRRGKSTWILAGALLGASIVALLFQTEVDASNRFSPPAWNHWLGTDALGRDVLVRMCQGLLASCFVAFTSASSAFVLGATAGTAIAYRGGSLDVWAQRFVNGFASVPRIPVLLILLVVELPGESNLPHPAPQVVKLMLALSMFAWMTPYRLARAGTRGLVHKEVVLAARGLGGSDAHILRKHIAPLLLPTLLVAITHAIAEMILLESTLSYLGFGIPSPYPSLGTMLALKVTDLERAPALVLAPVFLTGVVVAALYAFAERLAARQSASLVSSSE